MLFGMSTEIWVIVGLGVLVIMFLFSFLARLYRKAGPQRLSSFTVWAVPEL
jgi:hypothetical protein